MPHQITITKPIEELIDVFKKRSGFEVLAAGKDEPRIKIHETVGKVAYVYEKIRNAIDYQEEHLIRKNAIARMLRRRLMSQERGMVIAEPLVRELIRAGYLQNDYFPEKRMPDVEQIVNKYVMLIQLATAQQSNADQRTSIKNWIISVASYELEEYLSPSITDDALVEAMYKVLRPHLDLVNDIGNAEDHDIQVYIAIHRALIKSDHAMLRYHLTYYYAPEWRYITPEEIPNFASRLPALINRIELQINNKMSDRLFRYAKKFGPYFTILKDVLRKTPDIDRLIANPEAFETAIREACQERYTQASTKLTRGVVRSIIYIFLTKTILAFTIELPYEALLLHHVKLLPLGVNVIFHPILMSLIAISIRVPAEQNTQKLIRGIKEVVYNPSEKEIFTQKEIISKRSTFLGVIFTILYFIGFVLTFGLIIWGLNRLEFSLASAALFLFFLCIISFFGLRLRQNAKELVVVNPRENLFMIIFDFFSLPILRAGRYIARKTSQINFFLFIMDFIIEAPFKVLVETVEDWVAFQRQKKEEII